MNKIEKKESFMTKMKKNIKNLFIPSARLKYLTQEINSSDYEDIIERKKFLFRLNNPMTIIGILIILFIIFLTIFADLISPYSYNEARGVWTGAYDPPSSKHPLGQTELGRDVLARIIYGTRISLLIAFPIVLFSAIFGIIIGLIAGYYGSWIDSILMRISDILLAFPGLIFALVFIALFGQKIEVVMLALGILGIPYYARLIRGNVIQARELPYVKAAKSVGAKDNRIMFRHILPNVIYPIIISITFDIGSVLLTLSALSYLGFGDNRLIEWGNDISIAHGYVQSAPWASLFPGIMIFITVFGFMLLGDGLRDALDPRLQHTKIKERNQKNNYSNQELKIHNEILLSVQNLTTYFYSEIGVVKAVDDVSFNIKKNEVLGLVGETGCGKSVTALSILRLIRLPGKIINGTIVFNNINLLGLSKKKLRDIRGNEIAIIFQDPLSYLNPVLSIGKQLKEVFLLHQKEDLENIILNRKNETNEIVYMNEIIKEQSIQIIKEVGISDPEQILKQYPHQLSGGMRQRIMIAMALICTPKLLIADEPTTALDVTIQAQILELIKQLREKYNSSLLLITHDLGVISEVSDNVAVMYSGNIVEYAPVKQLFETPKHPYTKGLMKAIPDITKKDRKLYSIRGIVPNLVSIPSGCKFHPRCRQRLEICDKIKPKWIEENKLSGVMCHLYDPEYKNSPKYKTVL